MEINFKEFKKKLIDDEITIKEWCVRNGFDRDRLKNIKYGVVKATDEEIRKINSYSGVENE